MYSILVCTNPLEPVALEECPVQENMTVLTDSKSSLSMDLLQSMQRRTSVTVALEASGPATLGPCGQPDRVAGCSRRGQAPGES